MLLVKILKRRDASSIIIAIVVAMILAQLLNALLAELSGRISGLQSGQYLTYAASGAGWKSQYLNPVVFAALQLIALEILAWIVVWFKGSGKK
jgi:hypothetical protein